MGIRDGNYRLLLLRYRRAGREGVLALAANAAKDEIVLRAHDSAGTSAAVRRLRAGPHASALAAKSVAVVGCGAVGSFVADGLARAGVGSLTLQDGDVLRPGNLVRHLATDGEVGLVKPEAVRQALTARGLLPADCHTINAPLIHPSAARDLLSRNDLVIDASADGAVTSLLRHAAEDAAAVVLTICTQNGGDTVRVDLLPPLAEASTLPATTQREPQQPEMYEGGCGSPVSPTPPYAATEAAALAVRHACQHLLGTPLVSDGEVHEYPRLGDD
jgi:ThiF family